MSEPEVQWESIDCPICSSKNHTLWRTVSDRFDAIPGKKFSIVSCDDCGFRFLNPRPTEDSISIFYESEGYDPFLSTKESFSPGDLVYSGVRKFSLWRKRLLIEEFRRSGSILDVGCGTGELLEYLRQFDWQVEGVEAAQPSREFVQKKGITVHAALDEVGHRTFEVITLWHVLEHLHQLESSVEQLSTSLGENGILIIAVPNVESWDARRYQEDWIALDTPRHLYHFDEMDMQKLFQNQLLRFVESRGLWLDTIYNVLFSEQRRNQRNGNRWRPLFALNSIFGSYIHDYQSQGRRASASVYIFRKEDERG